MQVGSEGAQQHNPAPETGAAAHGKTANLSVPAGTTASVQPDVSQCTHQEEKLRSELKAARAHTERLQGENERLMEVGAELRAERELLVSHLTPAFVEAVRSGTAPPVATGNCSNAGAAGSVGGAPVQLMQQSYWTQSGGVTDAQDVWAPDEAEGYTVGTGGWCDGVGFSHGPGQGWGGAVVNPRMLQAYVRSTMDAGQWWSPPVQDAHAFDFVCQNTDPNTTACVDSLWVRESQVLQVENEVHASSDAEDDSQQPRLIQAVHNGESSLEHVCTDSGAAEPLQRLQKCVDTSDLGGERQDVPVVTVGDDLTTGIPWLTGSKGMQTGLRGSGQRWPIQNSARGTESQRTRLHALSKRRDGQSKLDGAAFEPSIRARNWNLCENGS